MLNKSGPSTLPCGTPQLIGKFLFVCLFVFLSVDITKRKTKKIAYAGLELKIKKFNEIYFHLADLKAFVRLTQRYLSTRAYNA